MNSIQIDIRNYGNNIYIYIDVKNNVITLNTIKKDIKEEKIYDLLRIIRSWENNYYDSKKMDAESFTITIETSEGTDIINGQGKYPTNYLMFKEWIRDIYE